MLSVWLTIHETCQRLARQSLDGLLPPRCPACGILVREPQRLCSACFAQLNFITAPLCLRCGLAFATLAEAGPQGTCLGCTLRPPRFDRCRGALRYDDQARRLILPFKHADRTEIAPVLAAIMARAGKQLLEEADILLPVPLHRRRLAQRRYNQAGLLAARLAHGAGRPWIPDGIIRHQATIALGDLSAAARRDTVAGAFRLHPAQAGAIRNKRLLLIDDVMTSGATASACAEVLREGGAAAVDVLVAARVPPPRSEKGSHARDGARTPLPKPSGTPILKGL